MNPELLKLLGQAAPLVAEWLAKPKPRIDEIEMTGERFIQFLKACTSPDVQVLANAIDSRSGVFVHARSITRACDAASAKACVVLSGARY